MELIWDTPADQDQSDSGPGEVPLEFLYAMALAEINAEINPRIFAAATVAMDGADAIVKQPAPACAGLQSRLRSADNR